MNVTIASFYMNNIDPKTVKLQKKVVQKFNPLNYPHFQFQTSFGHAESMDLLWKQLEFNMVSAKVDPAVQNDHVVVFLDIDAFPVVDDALDFIIRRARDGALVGDVQRSNHIQNNEHLFAAPSVVAMTYGTFCKIGKPSAVPNARGDVGEEYTFAAEAAHVPVELFMPLKYDHPVKRMHWETDQSPGWKLREHLPDYGIGTTFGQPTWGTKGIFEDRPLFYHNFQIFHPGNQEIFWAKAEEMLK